MYVCGVRVCGLNVWGGWVRVCVCGFFLCCIECVCMVCVFVCGVLCVCGSFVCVCGGCMCVCVLWVCIVWSVTCDVSRMW